MIQRFLPERELLLGKALLLGEIQYIFVAHVVCKLSQHGFKVHCVYCSNKLESLPGWISDCFFLVHLNASHNQLLELPNR